MVSGFYQERLMLAAESPILKLKEMKYRIKEIEYADGTKAFWTQEKRPYDITKAKGSGDERVVLFFLVIMTFPISIWFFLLKFYISRSSHEYIENARMEIDRLLLEEDQKTEVERLKKLRNKIVKTNFTKYP